MLIKKVEKSRIIPFIFLVLAISFIALGIFRHEYMDVLQKATKI